MNQIKPEVAALLQAIAEGMQVQVVDTSPLTKEPVWTDISGMNSLLLISTGQAMRVRVKPNLKEFTCAVPTPVAEALEEGSCYYIPDFHSSALYRTSRWDNDKTDRLRLKRGLIHLTAANAVEHAQALIAGTEQQPPKT